MDIAGKSYLRFSLSGGNPRIVISGKEKDLVKRVIKKLIDRGFTTVDIVKEKNKTVLELQKVTPEEYGYIELITDELNDYINRSPFYEEQYVLTIFRTINKLPKLKVEFYRIPEDVSGNTKKEELMSMIVRTIKKDFTFFPVVIGGYVGFISPYKEKLPKKFKVNVDADESSSKYLTFVQETHFTEKLHLFYIRFAIRELILRKIIEKLEQSGYHATDITEATSTKADISFSKIDRHLAFAFDILFFNKDVIGLSVSPFYKFILQDSLFEMFDRNTNYIARIRDLLYGKKVYFGNPLSHGIITNIFFPFSKEYTDIASQWGESLLDTSLAEDNNEPIFEITAKIKQYLDSALS